MGRGLLITARDARAGGPGTVMSRCARCAVPVTTVNALLPAQVDAPVGKALRAGTTRLPAAAFAAYAGSSASTTSRAWYERRSGVM